MFTDHLTSAIIKLNAHLSVDYINAAGEALFELGKNKVLGQPIDLVMLLPELDQQNFILSVKNVLESNQPFTCREAILRVGLHDKIIDYTVLPFLDKITNEYEVIIEIQLIERLISLVKEEQLNEQRQLARKMVRAVAHEIKNPLAGIRGATQLLQRALATSPDYLEYTYIIIQEVDRLKNLVDAMLGAQGMLKFEETNIHQILEHVRVLLLSQGQMPHHPLTIVQDYDLSLPELQADASKMIQVFLNMGVNALEALRQQAEVAPDFKPCMIFKTRIHPLMTMHGVKHRSVIRIDVIDNGIGIPADILSSVFYPMMTGRANGTGLGLSIAQDIAHKHQGLITCESTTGHTQFSLFLPWKTK